MNVTAIAAQPLLTPSPTILRQTKGDAGLASEVVILEGVMVGPGKV